MTPEQRNKLIGLGLGALGGGLGGYGFSKLVGTNPLISTGVGGFLGAGAGHLGADLYNKYTAQPAQLELTPESQQQVAQQVEKLREKYNDKELAAIFESKDPRRLAALLGERKWWNPGMWFDSVFSREPQEGEMEAAGKYMILPTTIEAVKAKSLLGGARAIPAAAAAYATGKGLSAWAREYMKNRLVDAKLQSELETAGMGPLEQAAESVRRGVNKKLPGTVAGGWNEVVRRGASLLGM